MYNKIKTFFPLLCYACVACNDAQNAQTTTVAELPKVEFSADSAWHYVDQQVAFGPRVPNSEAHAKCLDFLCNTLTRHGAIVELQEGEMRYFDGKPAPIRNIIGHFGEQTNKRIVLCAHWDCRMFSDHDPNPALRNLPVSGANDGASGVGVLLEVARQFSLRQPQVGVDIVFFDNEDNGTPDHLDVESQVEDPWCLGSQLWASEIGKQSSLRYGILLDMVGAPEAVFYKEKYSVRTARHIVDKIWKTAAELGYDNYFVAVEDGYITDDHYYMCEIAGVPTADIIQLDRTSSTGFGSYWHTQNDVMENVDRNTLEAVGRTVLTVVYSEK